MCMYAFFCNISRVKSERANIFGENVVEVTGEEGGHGKDDYKVTCVAKHGHGPHDQYQM